MIGAGEVHLWWASPPLIQDPSVLERQLEALSSEERARLARFAFERDRHQFLVSHALVRDALSHYAPAVAPAAWRFETNAYGKPAVAGPDWGGQRQGLCFNLSHTQGRAVVAVARGRAVGVDVEAIRPQIDAIELARRFFSPSEVAVIAEEPDRFFDVWTLKEAYIKARGMGLSLPLDSFSIHFAESGYPCLEIHAPGDDAARWFLQHWKQDGYCVGLTVSKLAGEARLRVSEREHTPMERCY